MIKILALIPLVALASCASDWSDKHPWMVDDAARYATLAPTITARGMDLDCPPDAPKVTYDAVNRTTPDGVDVAFYTPGHVQLPKGCEKDIAGSICMTLVTHEYAHHCGANEAVADLVDGEWRWVEKD